MGPINCGGIENVLGSQIFGGNQEKNMTNII